MRFKYETRDKKVSALLRELDQEITNMVPYRQYHALVNCMDRVKDILEDLVISCQDKDKAEKGRYALAAMEIILTGDIPQIDKGIEKNAEDIEEFWREIYRDELRARTQHQSDNIKNNI